ncbi:MAG: D-alanyl-D-alanine carboxypeptidase [Rhizobiales bacterium]|nr:D-alanyl-D-alanine carboxypeptidase [Hyphomicrobiales bacterium]
MVFIGAALRRVSAPGCQFLWRGVFFSLILLFGAFVLAQPGVAKVAFSAISVDARTGKVLSSVDPDGRRHPASLTKMMTLYLVFEDLESGKIKLTSPIVMSARAARMQPSKLGVKPGAEISVELAIKALVVKSANDVAAAVGESLGGTEAAFAERMTRTAQRLGMSRTVFRNASGLPNPAQVTTARDMATLGLRLQRDFPQYYPYFRTMAFTYRGRTTATHNRLLGKYAGTDGIKTGYIHASGFNLTTSAKRGDKRIVGVVLGGTSGKARNAYMKKMLDKAFPKCVDGKTIAALAGSSTGAIDPLAAAMAEAAQSSTGGEHPGDVKTAATAKAETAVPEKKPEPKIIEATLVPSVLPKKLPFEVKPQTKQADVKPVTTKSVASKKPATKTVASLPAGAWNIQIGAYATKKDAASRLTKLRADGPTELRGKPAFTVTVQKGDKTTYRARFSGFTEKAAREACKQLARVNTTCYVVAPKS